MCSVFAGRTWVVQRSQSTLLNWRVLQKSSTFTKFDAYLLNEANLLMDPKIKGMVGFSKTTTLIIFLYLSVINIECSTFFASTHIDWCQWQPYGQRVNEQKSCVFCEMSAMELKIITSCNKLKCRKTRTNSEYYTNGKTVKSLFNWLQWLTCHRFSLSVCHIVPGIKWFTTIYYIFNSSIIAYLINYTRKLNKRPKMSMEQLPLDVLMGMIKANKNTLSKIEWNIYVVFI